MPHPVVPCLLAIALTLMGNLPAADKNPPGLPDLTQDRSVDRNGTYNLGATGLRGWIYSKPANNLDSLQGRTTTASRQILVTHVGVKSPAEGVMQVDDVITGVGGKPFSEDARKSLAAAIQEAEQEAHKGLLTLTRWRAGISEEVQLKLRVMGAYSATAPYDCPKSKRILDEACQALEKEALTDDWHGAINGLALMASGKPEFMPKVKAFARKLGSPTLKLELQDGMVVWDWGYKGLFLSEYFLLTGDKEVWHAVQEYTISLAKGQSMYGTCGHGIAPPTAEGKLHGSIPPYGPVNEAGLIGNLAIVMGRKCGVKDPEIEPAIQRLSGFFGYFVDKGAIPYGEHEPWPYHENNGKCSMAAHVFGQQGNRTSEAQFFAKMSIAGFKNRECGHTGQGFSYLWSALGASVGGPDATVAFVKESSWHLDLVRRCDGSFTYDGREQFGPGRTHDNTYFGASSYNGLSPNATYVLTYSLPLKKLCITGKNALPANYLSKKEVADALASGRFDLERKQKSAEELLTAFNDWSPIVRSWAADELSRRPEVQSLVPQLITLAKGTDIHAAQGACETLGLLKSTEALPVFVRLLSHQDRWLRYKAAQAIRKLGDAAKPAIPEILTALVATAEPLQPVNWADPIQIAHGQLAFALFSGPLADAVKEAEVKLLYPAIRAMALNADGMARAQLRSFFEKRLTLEDVQALAPDLLAAVKTRCPADTMFGSEIRLGAFKALTKYHFTEAIAAGVELALTQGGHGSQKRTPEIMKEIVLYGSAARAVIPRLKELIIFFNEQCQRGDFPSGAINELRTNAVLEAIATIEAAKDHPALRTITPRP